MPIVFIVKMLKINAKYVKITFFITMENVLLNVLHELFRMASIAMIVLKAAMYALVKRLYVQNVLKATIYTIMNACNNVLLQQQFLKIRKNVLIVKCLVIFVLIMQHHARIVLPDIIYIIINV